MTCDSLAYPMAVRKGTAACSSMPGGPHMSASVEGDAGKRRSSNMGCVMRPALKAQLAGGELST